jgi:hypothetical protein
MRGRRLSSRYCSQRGSVAPRGETTARIALGERGVSVVRAGSGPPRVAVEAVTRCFAERSAVHPGSSPRLEHLERRIEQRNRARDQVLPPNSSRHLAWIWFITGDPARRAGRARWARHGERPGSSPLAVRALGKFQDRCLAMSIAAEAYETSMCTPLPTWRRSAAEAFFRKISSLPSLLMSADGFSAIPSL